MKLYLSPTGKDTNNGTSPDTALATLKGAEQVVSALRAQGIKDEIFCHVLAGNYVFKEPFVISPLWNHVSLAGERDTVFTGSRDITNFEECVVNDKRAFRSYLKDVEHGTWYFRQLFVNGEARNRSRLPESGFYWMDGVPGIDFNAALFDGSSSFIFKNDDIKKFHNLFDVEVVVMHYWIDEHMPIRSVSMKEKVVHLGKTSIFALKDDFVARYAKYYIENTFEGLQCPGQWYLDRTGGYLYYLPYENETIENIAVTAPYTSQLLNIAGCIEQDGFVEDFNIKNITFAYTDWYQPIATYEYGSNAGVDYASAPQAADAVPAVITLSGAKKCSIKNCLIHDIGFYGIEVGNGCRNISITHNHIYRGGAGGIRAGGASIYGSAIYRCFNNEFSFNHIYDCGRIFHSATGIFLKHSYDNKVWNNHIHDMYYSGISSGWVWGYVPNISCRNSICFNHIHDLGKGVLSDMGGIYILGSQPGTEIKNNLIYGIESSNYGGWALYTDEGSSHIVIENNICMDTSSHVFHQHYGAENIVRNNIFCFGKEGVIAFPKGTDRTQYTFTRNIVVTNGSKPFHNKYGVSGEFFSDCNLFFDASEDGAAHIDEWLSQWQAQGRDKHSLTGDPGFANIEEKDFSVAVDSPARLIGFQDINMCNVGV